MKVRDLNEPGAKSSEETCIEVASWLKRTQPGNKLLSGRKRALEKLRDARIV